MRCVWRRVSAGLAIAFAMGLASCAHDRRSPSAANVVQVRATNGSAFVVCSLNAPQAQYGLRGSVNLEITPTGELVPGENRFSAGLVLPVAPSKIGRASCRERV